MKSFRKIAAVALLALYGASVFASCPPYAPYRCVQGMNGKQICGCGV